MRLCLDDCEHLLEKFWGKGTMVFAIPYATLLSKSVLLLSNASVRDKASLNLGSSLEVFVKA